MKTKAGIFLSNFTDGNDLPSIEIKIQDQNSRATVAKLTFSAADFTKLITLGYVNADMEFDHEEAGKVGMYRVVEDWQFTVPGIVDKSSATRLAALRCPEGWKPRLIFNSKDSITRNPDGTTTIKTKIFRYTVNPPNNDEKR